MSMTKPLQAPEITKHQLDAWKRSALDEVKSAKVSGGKASGGYALAFAKVLHKIMQTGADFRRRKFQEIDERLAALEKGGSMADSYQGSFDPERTYARGQTLTHQGGLWLCLHEVQGEKPGPSPSFRLILKGR